MILPARVSPGSTYRISSINRPGVYVFRRPFTRRLLETGAYSRQAFIFTCTIFERARAPFDAQR